MAHDDLLDAVRRDPDDPAAWAVLQDWLLAHDDPRGTLATATGDDLVARLSHLLPQWFGRPVHPLIAGWRIRRRHRAEDDIGVRFIGDDGDAHGPAVELVFERGHIRRLTVDTRWDGNRADWGQTWSLPLVNRILNHPVGGVVVDLEIRATPWSDFFYPGLIEGIVAAGPLPVRRVYCGDDDQLSWTNVPDLSALWAAAPHMEEVVLEGANIRLGPLDHPTLRKLHLISGGLPQEPVHALARASVPALEDLDVWFGDPEYGAECTMDEIRLLFGTEFPALRRMALSNCEHGDAVAAEVHDAVWLPRIRRLSFHGSILTPAGADALIRARERLNHLDELDVDQCFLDDDAVARMKAAFGARLHVGEQRVPDDDNGELFYYVSVGE